ncbi:hypothetical protein M2T75_34340, partial [Klebsiella pneumoniae]|nr:hypothetical protein [Klebsiella pneumoniae]
SVLTKKHNCGTNVTKCKLKSYPLLNIFIVHIIFTLIISVTTGHNRNPTRERLVCRGLMPAQPHGPQPARVSKLFVCAAKK